ASISGWIRRAKRIVFLFQWEPTSISNILSAEYFLVDNELSSRVGSGIGTWETDFESRKEQDMIGAAILIERGKRAVRSFVEGDGGLSGAEVCLAWRETDVAHRGGQA
ncbi:MAG: hypothetical protein AAF492_15605, partial [Verrucomicrobiota bacterium]